MISFLLGLNSMGRSVSSLFVNFHRVLANSSAAALPTYDGKFTNSEDNTATYAILSKQNDIIQNRKINKTFISFSQQANKQYFSFFVYLCNYAKLF